MSSNPITDETRRYQAFEPGSSVLIDLLVTEHHGWATSIAKSVARGWNMDWQLDGLDGGAYEGLLFCARRYDPSKGVPFRAYARRRIHEACTEEARKSKNWQQSTGGEDSEAELEARELSAKIFDLFPELREGFLPSAASGSSEDTGIKDSIKQLLTGASLIAAFQESASENQENLVDYKRLVELMTELEPVHQDILWAIYYQGQSMRALAESWGLDDLSIIREHKEILSHLADRFSEGRASSNKNPLKVRRGLRTKALDLKKKKEKGSFSRMLEGTLGLFAIFASSVLTRTLVSQALVSQVLS
ncbi:MAG TPA: sigma-70 family RNA polymerase sigma factor [Oligoflexia bacterium]|nr:sigma-70 family RNA polymerase sigma factor [Oligoflexia bacterium]HMP48428.1 sigma-70 family RNA polymerase sigma factor [Oligoflexia bacterium]